MATPAQIIPQWPDSLAWLPEFIRHELAPYPGRVTLVARMVIAATLVMIICMVFRIPYGFQGSIYALLVSRESPRATLQSSGTIFLVTAIGAAYVLISVCIVISVPFLHFLWVVGSLFAAFFVLSTINSYGAASTFAIMISVGVPIWDRHDSGGTNVADTLWLSLAASVGVLVTAAVELAFAHRKPGDDIVLPLAERLTAVHNLLTCYLENRPADSRTQNELTSLTMQGTSTLRRSLRRSDYSRHYQTQMGSVIGLVGRLVDVAASLPQLAFTPSDGDEGKLRDLDTAILKTRNDLLARRIPDLSFCKLDYAPSQSPALLREMEMVVALIPHAFADSHTIDEYRSSSDDKPPQSLVAPDSLANPEHLHFALKGTLAASLCYILYNAIAWPGISTAVTTCLLTALSTIGSSRQKQVLRIAGAVVGGFILGMGSQVFVLPYLDSIVGFTVLFVLVTVLASWIMTSSPRLSYCGVQIALAFYLINVEEFAMQTSLSVARDRVIGILLGLFMMWLIFDQLWGTRAALEMRRAFITNLRQLAELVRQPTPGRERTWHSYALRETIHANFDKVRSLADGVLFEVGSPTRQQDLALRSLIRRMQPQLRILFVTRIALLKYRLQIPGFELPRAVAAAQHELDDKLAVALEELADRMDGRPAAERPAPDTWLAHLEQTIANTSPEEPHQTFDAGFQVMLSLDRRVRNLMVSLIDGISEGIPREVTEGISTRGARW